MGSFPRRVHTEFTHRTLFVRDVCPPYPTCKFTNVVTVEEGSETNGIGWIAKKPCGLGFVNRFHKTGNTPVFNLYEKSLRLNKYTKRRKTKQMHGNTSPNDELDHPTLRVKEEEQTPCRKTQPVNPGPGCRKSIATHMIVVCVRGSLAL